MTRCFFNKTEKPVANVFVLHLKFTFFVQIIMAKRAGGPKPKGPQGDNDDD